MLAVSADPRIRYRLVVCTSKSLAVLKIVQLADTQPHLMHWFKRYEDPAPPQTFLDKFFAGRDDPKQVASF